MSKTLIFSVTYPSKEKNRMQISLEEKHALVLGSSKGIGRAIATQLANAGARVTCAARSEVELKKLVNTLGESHAFISVDLSKYDESITALERYILENPVDILINNTGGPSPGTLMEADWDQFAVALQMHLRVSHALTGLVLPQMKTVKYGRIINIISTSVKIPIPGLGVSNTVRGAMASWSKTLATEVAPFGITVNNILPGFIATGRLDALIEKNANDSNVSFEKMQAQMEKSVPAGRFGLPEEIGYYATFLASDLARYITGTSLQVDGGRTGSL